MIIKSVNGETIEIADDGKVTYKKPSLWQRIKTKAGKTVDWCKKHPQETITIATLALGAVAGTVGYVSKQYRVYETKQLKERYIYDRSNGHYFKMNRVPSTNQWLEIETRKKAGESLGIILQDMKLL